jgi:hypothetical protein
MAIGGGEPLVYPSIVETVRLIAERGIKPLIISNGVSLTATVLRQLVDAGLVGIHLHIDSGQQRPGWERCTESELNVLRQHYADMARDAGLAHCGYHLTVSTDNLESIPDVVEWSLGNIDRVAQIIFVAFRGLPAGDEFEFTVNGSRVPAGDIGPVVDDRAAISITTEQMLARVTKRLSWLRPAAYMNGTTAPLTYKNIFCVAIGGRAGTFGCLGPKAVEFVQVLSHLTRGKYFGLSRRRTHATVFLAGVIDSAVRSAFGRWLASGCLQRVSTQTIQFQQPIELIDGEFNLCDGCTDMLVYDGRPVQPCRLDGYRLYGGPVVPIRRTNPCDVMSSESGRCPACSPGAPCDSGATQLAPESAGATSGTTSPIS